MPSRLVFICPRGTTSAGTDFSTSPPTARRSSVSRAALVCPPAVSTSTLYSSISIGNADRFRGLPGQHHRGCAGVDHHRRLDAVDLGVQRELAGLAACDLHRGRRLQAAVPQHFRNRGAGARDLFGIAIGDDGAGGRGEHREHEQHADHSAPPSRVRVSRAPEAAPSARGRLPPCARQALPSRPIAPRCPSDASARSPATFVRSRSRVWFWGPSCRLRYTAFLCSLRDSEMVSVACASAPVTTRFRRS